MEIVDRVRQILATRGLTLYQVSQRSAEVFGESSLYFIPQRLYHELGIGALNPNIHQFAALSRISNYRISDWLAAFGFRLDDIPRLQLLIPWRRTVLLDSSVYDLEQEIPWFDDKAGELERPALAPLGQFLIPSAPKRAKDLLALNKRKFLYAKIGYEDTFAFPTLLPGSVARINVQYSPELGNSLELTNCKRIFLVQHGLALNCGYLTSIDNARFALTSTHFPFRRVELTLGDTVKILGLVDAELRPIVVKPGTEISRGKSGNRAGSDPMPRSSSLDLRQLIRTSRMGVGVSFRQASTITRWIARTLNDPMYFAAAGTLSDYEKVSSPLRHVQKLISLCILYCIDFWTFLRSAGIPTEFLGNDPLPDELIPRPLLPSAADFGNESRSGKKEAALLSWLIEQWEELPLFMKSGLPAISGLKDISITDIFWLGASEDPMHPALTGASLLVVNRRIKIPVKSTAPTVWEQPLYVVLLRGGSYLCCSCELRGGILIANPHSQRPQRSIKLRNGIDAEVVGQVTAILRRLS
jgi:hypothetical protein